MFALLFWEVEMSLFWFDLKTKRDRTPEKARLITKAFFPLARWVGSWNQVIEERIPNEGTWLKLSNCELCYLVLRFFLQALASTENILKHGNLFLAVLWKNKEGSVLKLKNILLEVYIGTTLGSSWTVSCISFTLTILP